MKRFPSVPCAIALGGLVWLFVLACRTGDLVALTRATATRTVTRIPSVRPTFTPLRPTASPTSSPSPTPLPTRTATTRPTRTSTRKPPPTVRPSATVPPPTAAAPAPTATPDVDAGYYFRVAQVTCGPGENTRIQGTVVVDGAPQDGVLVRVSYEAGGPRVIDDFVTGVDPADHRHVDPSLQGKYQLGLAEGQRIKGDWYVFVVDRVGDPKSRSVYVHTSDAAGCNTATVNFVH